MAEVCDILRDANLLWEIRKAPVHVLGPWTQDSVGWTRLNPDGQISVIVRSSSNLSEHRWGSVPKSPDWKPLSWYVLGPLRFLGSKEDNYCDSFEQGREQADAFLREAGVLLIQVSTA